VLRSSSLFNLYTYQCQKITHYKNLEFHPTTEEKTRKGSQEAENRDQQTGECWCCDRKARAASAQSFTLRQQATIEITRRDHSIIACSCHVYMGA